MNLDQLIAKLTEIRDEHGGLIPVKTEDDGFYVNIERVSLKRDEQGYRVCIQTNAE